MNGDMMFVGRGWNEGNICLATMHFCATHKQRNEARHERISSILTGGGNASRCLWAMLSQLLLLQCPLSSFTNSRRFFFSIFSSVLFFAVFYTLSRGFFCYFCLFHTHTHEKYREFQFTARTHISRHLFRTEQQQQQQKGVYRAHFVCCCCGCCCRFVVAANCIYIFKLNANVRAASECVAVGSWCCTGYLCCPPCSTGWVKFAYIYSRGYTYVFPQQRRFCLLKRGRRRAASKILRIYDDDDLILDARTVSVQCTPWTMALLFISCWCCCCWWWMVRSRYFSPDTLLINNLIESMHAMHVDNYEPLSMPYSTSLLLLLLRFRTPRKTCLAVDGRTIVVLFALYSFARMYSWNDRQTDEENWWDRQKKKIIRGLFAI